MNWKAKIILIPLLAYALAVVVGATAWGFGLLNSIGKIDNTKSNGIETFDKDTEDDDTITDNDINFGQKNRVLENQDVINILLVGQDDDHGSHRSDSMIILSLNRKTKDISMISLMRDMYVQIPGYSNNKLNAAFSFGGYSLLNETIEENFGIKINYNIGVNFETFQKIIDKLGGIDIKLTEDEANYIMKKTKNYDAGLTEGVNHLTGKQALWYARTRYVSTETENNDFGRTSRQRVVLQTLYKELMKLPLTELVDVAYEVVADVETDMAMTEILSLGSEVYSMNLGSINNYRIPYDNEFTDETINGMMVLVVDFDQIKDHLEEWIYHTNDTLDVSTIEN